MHTNRPSISDVLLNLGWTSFFEPYFAELPRTDLALARVLEEHKGSYVLGGAAGQYRAKIGGALRHRVEGRGDLPAVGDWVASTAPGVSHTSPPIDPQGVAHTQAPADSTQTPCVDRPAPNETSHAAISLVADPMRISAASTYALIEYIFPRRSKFSRKVAGRQRQEQIVAANLDVVFVVGAINRDFNLRRLERYLALVWESGAQPVVLLNKADLCADREALLAEAASVAPGVDVHLLSACSGEGLDLVLGHLGRGRTAAFVGSSGVGKSTLINALLGSEQLAVSSVREGDDRGRHTTTSRRMLFLPDGSLVIDTPGMRELQLWDADSGVERAFDDVAGLAEACRFRDCSHTGEPGCRVQTALDDGELDEERMGNYRKLQAELDFQRRKQDPKLLHEQKEKWKKLCNAARELGRRKR